MTNRAHLRRRDDRASGPIGPIVALLVAGVVLIAGVNIVMWWLAAGGINDGLQAGARVGAAYGATEQDCVDRANAALTGPIAPEGTSVARPGPITCEIDGDTITASAEMTLIGWLPIMPDKTKTYSKTEYKEAPPTITNAAGPSS